MNGRKERNGLHFRVVLTDTGFWRAIVQWGLFFWILIIGVQFGLFVHHFESGGRAAFFPRPPGIEGFLPIGALVSLKYWVTTGIFPHVHPAALVLFLTFLAMSLLAKKSFCSWLCPVGTLSECLWKVGRRIFGRNFYPWPMLDILLRGVKYLLLLFFARLILLDMPSSALEAFLHSPYWAVSDVKMLHFFSEMSTTTLVCILILVGLSLLYQNAWCRYLCPYGALLGLLSLMSPMKIQRREAACTDCHRCSKACPARLPIHRKMSVHSPECSGCLTCLNACPEQALGMTLSWRRISVPRWTFPLLVVAIYASGVAIGMVTGHWETSLTARDYHQLIPMVKYLSH
jgi:polyferredoxin